MKDNKKVKEIIKIFSENKNDPQGSYTGNAEDGGKPVQDADDL